MVFVLDTLMLTAWHGIRHCVATQPGRSVNTEPIGSVLRYLDKFGSSETGTDRFLKKFGIGKFGSVSVFTEQYRISHKEDVIAGSKTNFDIISLIFIVQNTNTYKNPHDYKCECQKYITYCL